MRETGALKASDLLVSAGQQLPSGRGRPLQTHLRRAVSTVYYALFHSLAHCCADSLVGKAARKTRTWSLAYRSLSHGRAREACGQKHLLRSFPQEIQSFADLFVDLQKERHTADYDPAQVFFKSDVVGHLRTARLTVERFEAADIRDRRAFAAHILFKERP